MFKPIILTLDDNAFNHYYNVFPLLKKYKMNNNKIKNLLLKSVINSDFLFLESVINKDLRHIKYKLNSQGLKVSSLDLFETLKSLKQLIRSLKFLSNQENHILHIWFEKKQYVRIIDSLINKRTFKSALSIKSPFSQVTKNLYKNHLLFLLNEPIKNDKQKLKQLLNEKIFLINKVNLKLEKNNWGSYKIYNEVNSFKKFLFLFIIIDLIFKNKKYASRKKI
jgi:hypothetical protein